MNLGRTLRGWFGPDPFADWPPERAIPLALSLRGMTLNGIGFGVEIVSLRLFGRPAVIGGDGVFMYPRSGCIIGADEEHGVDYFGIPLVKSIYSAGIHARSMELMLPDGSKLRLGADNRLDAILRGLGLPQYVDDNDDDEVVCYWERGGCRLEVETSPDLSLQRLNLYPTAGAWALGSDQEMTQIRKNKALMELLDQRFAETEGGIPLDEARRRLGL